MTRRTLYLAALLIIIPTIILFLISWQAQPLLPAPWNNALILLGIVLAAVLAGLSGIADTVQLARWISGPEETAATGPTNQSIAVNLRQGDITIIGDQAAAALLARWGKTSAGLQEAAGQYLRYLINRYRYLEFKGMGVSDRLPLNLALLDLYIPLQARIEMPEGETWSKELRDLSLAGRRMDALSDEERATLGRRISEPQPVLKLLQESPGLIILGDPGAGKTTFLKYLALCLATRQEVGLGERLPVLLPLSAYANALAQQRRLALPDFITAYYRELIGDDLPVGDLLETALAEGRALLLLDGLDEVKETGLRLQVVERVVQSFSFRQQQGNKFVLTSRIVGYKDVRPTTAGLAECTLIDFDRREIEAFVDRWTQAVEKAAQPDPQLATRAAQQEKMELLQAVDRNPGVRRLASNPLLLTILALMKRQGVTLPERRVQLYDQYVKTLLKHWNLARGLDSGHNRELDDVETLKVLAPLALWMHETSPGVGLVKEQAMRRRLRQLYQARGEREPDQAAGQFLQDARDHAGLLVERGQGNYGFIHLTFQEYLAAVGVAAAGQEDVQPVVDLLAKRLDEDTWREVIVLTVGYLGIVQQREAAAGKLVQLLVQQRPGTPGQAEIRAGEAVADAWPGGVSRQCRDDIVAALLAAMRDDGRVRPPQRAGAGRLLARLGDPRPEVLDIDQMQFCYVSPGPFWMGRNDRRYDEKPQHWLEMAQGYWLGRFPITNAQFAAFTAGGGYTEAKFWPEAKAAKVWRGGRVKGRWDKEPRDRPGDFSHPFNLPNHPVMGLTWYETLAFCRWLTHHWQAKGWLPPGWTARLPTEAEWEKGARGSGQVPGEPVIQPIKRLGRNMEPAIVWRNNPQAQAIYIWGNAPDPNRANYEASGVGTTNAIGCFPGGMSPYGLEEMAGNVCEWLQSKYKPYEYRADDGRERLDASDNPRVVRGASFFQGEHYTGCSARYRYDPGNDNVFVDYGFRVAVSPLSLNSDPDEL
jgi:formylglycine-generating enzyme required for sulfatase activity